MLLLCLVSTFLYAQGSVSCACIDYQLSFILMCHHVLDKQIICTFLFKTTPVSLHLYSYVTPYVYNLSTHNLILQEFRTHCTKHYMEGKELIFV
jgi:hypothetical protein